ncbi:MAG TPA: M28 family peptidase, partial [Telluria sp.]
PGRTYYTDYETTANVVGYLRGTEHPARYVVVSARFDSDGWANPRAEGNDSGIATLLAIATYLRSHPPRHTFVFAAFDGSRQGQAGADYFLDQPPVPRDHIGVNLNVDIVDSARGDMLVVAGAYHTPALAPLVRTAALSSPIPVHLGHDRPPWKAGAVADWSRVSGHAAFHEKGIPFLYATVAGRDAAGADPQFDPNCCVDAANFLLALALGLDTGFDTLVQQK